MADFHGRIRLGFREGLRGALHAGPRRDTLLSRIGEIRSQMDAHERRLRGPRRTRGPQGTIERFRGGLDRLELTYQTGDPKPRIEIREDSAEGFTRVFADGCCVAVLRGIGILTQGDVVLIRDVTARPPQ